MPAAPGLTSVSVGANRSSAGTRVREMSAMDAQHQLGRSIYTSVLLKTCGDTFTVSPVFFQLSVAEVRKLSLKTLETR